MTEEFVNQTFSSH